MNDRLAEQVKELKAENEELRAELEGAKDRLRREDKLLSMYEQQLAAARWGRTE